MRASIALALLLSSCSTMIDEDLKQPIKGSPWPRELVIQAVEDFIEANARVFPEERGESARCVAITFVPHLEHPKLGNLSGIADSRCAVRVSTEYTTELHYTALWHELTHTVLWNTYDEPDASHTIPPGPWTTRHNELITDLRKAWD